MGSGFNGPSSLWDHDHEGHSGWRIDQIDANVVGWVRQYQPRAVLLHIGTNDISQNRDLWNAPNRLAGVIDKITSTSPQTDVFVATLIPVSYAQSQVQSYNSAVPGIVSSRAAAGQRVHLVDMNRAVSLSDMPDGVHPNANGYDRMAAVWYDALRSVPGLLDGSTPTPSPTPTASPTASPTPTPSPTPSPSPTPTPTPGPGNGPVDTSAWYTLVNRGSGKAIDVYNYATNDGARITQWSRHGGDNQQWQFVSVGNGYYQLRSRLSGKVLDVSGNSTADGGNVVQYTDWNGTNQQWQLVKVG